MEREQFWKRFGSICSEKSTQISSLFVRNFRTSLWPQIMSLCINHQKKTLLFQLYMPLLCFYVIDFLCYLRDFKQSNLLINNARPKCWFTRKFAINFCCCWSMLCCVKWKENKQIIYLGELKWEKTNQQQAFFSLQVFIVFFRSLFIVFFYFPILIFIYKFNLKIDEAKFPWLSAKENPLSRTIKAIVKYLNKSKKWGVFSKQQQT